MRGHIILADWAEAIGGKLYIQGAGWTRIFGGKSRPVSMGVALMLLFDWDEANVRRTLKVKLVDDDGRPVSPQGGGQVEVAAELEVGRPPGIKRGTALEANLAFNLNGLVLDTGRYKFVVEVDGDPLGDGATFDVVSGLPPGGPG